LLDDRSINYHNVDDGHTIHLVMRKEISPTTSYGTLNSEASNAQISVVSMTTSNSNLQDTVFDIDNEENQLLNANIENNTNVTEMDTFDIIDVVRMCRLIRMFALVDCALLIMFAIWGNILFLCCIPLAISGYIGAKSLKSGFLFLYGVFIMLSMVLRVYLAFIYLTWSMLLLCTISILFELYIFYQTICVLAIIPQLTNNDRRIFNQLSRFVV